MLNATDALLDFWLTTGRFGAEFEYEFGQFVGTTHAVLVNSGSSANLLALSALTSPKLKERRLEPGDEVIAAAAAFPTTVNPIFQNGLVPVFVDIELGTYNIRTDLIEAAITDRTKAVFVAHTLGNPFDLGRMREICRRRNLWLIEDACDALGATYDGQMIGTFGDLATFSFYPAHQMTMGEGGAVVTSSDELATIVRSFRDWGRDCYCEPGESNTCGKRFQWQLGTLPFGYDHKYTFSHIGYNLKVTDFQPAIGLAQLKKVPEFVRRRRANFDYLRAGLSPFEPHLILPRAAPRSDPSWFGFIISVRKESPFTKAELVRFLEENKIETRMVFCGNVVRQPAYEGKTHRVCGDLDNTDFVMNNSFFIGVYPGLSEKHLDYVIGKFAEFFRSRSIAV
jgi:CDP-6-deoxy-D-xylo-4-hexulose-3-dehydrase